MISDSLWCFSFYGLVFPRTGCANWFCCIWVDDERAMVVYSHDSLRNGRMVMGV